MVVTLAIGAVVYIDGRTPATVIGLRTDGLALVSVGRGVHQETLWLPVVSLRAECEAELAEAV